MASLIPFYLLLRGTPTRGTERPNESSHRSERFGRHCTTCPRSCKSGFLRGAQPKLQRARSHHEWFACNGVAVHALSPAASTCFSCYERPLLAVSSPTLYQRTVSSDRIMRICRYLISLPYSPISSPTHEQFLAWRTAHG